MGVSLQASHGVMTKDDRLLTRTTTGSKTHTSRCQSPNHCNHSECSTSPRSHGFRSVGVGHRLTATAPTSGPEYTLAHGAPTSVATALLSLPTLRMFMSSAGDAPSGLLVGGTPACTMTVVRKGTRMKCGWNTTRCRTHHHNKAGITNLETQTQAPLSLLFPLLARVRAMCIHTSERKYCKDDCESDAATFTTSSLTGPSSSSTAPSHGCVVVAQDTQSTHGDQTLNDTLRVWSCVHAAHAHTHTRRPLAIHVPK